MTKSTLLIRLATAGVAVLALTAAYQKASTNQTMASAAKELLRTLTPEQKAKIQFKFDDKERFTWDFRPVPRNGLPVREMQPFQKPLAHALLSAALGQRGYIKAATIMSLEDVLRIQEKDDGERRNPEKYFFSIFGEPSESGTWAFRVDGHHLSVNFTIVNGKVVAAPTFFGANPHEVRAVESRKGLRVLASEEDLGRELVQALTPEQRKIAIITEKAYPDIISDNKNPAMLKDSPLGLPAAKLNPKQKALLDAVVTEYANNMPADLAAERLEQYKKMTGQIHFAWAGGINKGDLHYYRVQSPTFLIEYDNTQNNGNHVHSVWRDFKSDFGLDLLSMHKGAQPK
jgi:hypothetical protein